MSRRGNSIERESNSPRKFMPTYEQIGKKIGLTFSHVHTIEKKAIEKMLIFLIEKKKMTYRDALLELSNILNFPADILYKRLDDGFKINIKLEIENEMKLCSCN